MERLKQWLNSRGITIVRPRLGDDGLVILRLHPPFGADFEVDFFPDDLEADPQNAIDFIDQYLATRQIKL